MTIRARQQHNRKRALMTNKEARLWTEVETQAPI